MTDRAKRRRRGGKRASAVRKALAAISLGSVLGAQAQVDVAQLSLDKLGDLSLEQLGSISITSVSRRTERLLQAPASVFVITAEDIQRSTVRTLPEALRLAPNLHVARTSAGQWAISARGFNNGIGNKLLVLVDGRTIYSPLFSGVFWDAQDVMLEDIEQIEVISGPGGTLWGANAVNGVINVTTRSAASTPGMLATASGGDANPALSARYGGKLGESGHYRIYAMHSDRDDTTRENGVTLPDAAHKTQAGFRADWGTRQSGVTVQGGAYRGSGIQPPRPESPQLSGAHLLARWSREAADGSNWRLQGYYDSSKREEAFTFNDEMEIADIEWQYSPAAAHSHRLVWGGGHREARDRTNNTLLVRFIPQDKRLRWTNIFVQDEIAVAEHLELTLGAKLERNVYTGWEFLPSARLAWTPDANRLAWAALSRAVRAPARLDREFFFPGNPPFFINGGPQFVSEVANVLEVGWRAQPS
ncbi:MAG TPA: TonB-dependent receptor, partial [Ramlibacter sp.]|nr:TonB-dependent receptor [Ramlibacter sp.]